ncbi:hypothetical protein CVT24_007791 [Panaeolus cyanescens]|uniref:C3HC-type domain-containing protein n=1 Tax=Panaeolus cyanescens TaxID=181874 RepID=A0A409YKV7_9AGAR|nr:hypothetical protein CVT24_007791 [Panaeolus cyanescens]
MADTTTHISESPSTASQNLRSTKRKLEDAFQVLDKAVSPTKRNLSSADGPSPPKRANTSRSLYSTLAKYGVKSKQSTTTPSLSESLSKKTPHLAAILYKAAARTKKTFTFKFSHPSTPTVLPPTAEYRPSSLPSFLSRLATYKLTTYANKPPQLDAVAASKCGWINEGKDRLLCGLCNASWVVAGREGLSRDAANALVEKQRVSLVEAHKQGCPWKTRQCDDSIYCIPLQSPGAMIREIKARAEEMEPVMKSVSIQHPLTQSQLSALRTAVTSYKPPESSAGLDQVMNDGSEEAPQYPESSILASLFGWSLIPLAPAKDTSRKSLTRPSSKNVSPFATPSISRASSVVQASPQSSRQSTPVPHFPLPSTVPKPENALLQCSLCQRRIGLWGFLTRPSPSTPETPVSDPKETTVTSPRRPIRPLPQRSFDLLKEHRSFCPYTVRSTVVPSLPVPPQAPSRSSTSGLGHASTTSLSQFSLKSDGSPSMEGWRAVLTVVLRYGMAQKQRVEYNYLMRKDTQSSIPESGEEGTDEMEVDNVKAMVAGVKSRGGKDLLQYVKGLLG